MQTKKPKPKKIPFWKFYQREENDSGIEYGAVFRGHRIAAIWVPKDRRYGRNICECKGEHGDQPLTFKQYVALAQMKQTLTTDMLLQLVKGA